VSDERVFSLSTLSFFRFDDKEKSKKNLEHRSGKNRKFCLCNK
jgi:hypothetical protein